MGAKLRNYPENFGRHTASDRIPDPSVRDTDGDDLRSAEIHTDDFDDFFMSIPKGDVSD